MRTAGPVIHYASSRGYGTACGAKRVLRKTDRLADVTCQRCQRTADFDRRRTVGRRRVR